MTYYAVQEWTGCTWRGTGTHFHDLPRMQQEIAWLQKTYPGARYRIAIMDGYAVVGTAPLSSNTGDEVHISITPRFKPGDPPPSGYNAWHAWAEVQYKAGLRQAQCAKCYHWISLAQEKHDCGATTGQEMGIE